MPNAYLQERVEWATALLNREWPCTCDPDVGMSPCELCAEKDILESFIKLVKKSDAAAEYIEALENDDWIDTCKEQVKHYWTARNDGSGNPLVCDDMMNKWLDALHNALQERKGLKRIHNAKGKYQSA